MDDDVKAVGDYLQACAEVQRQQFALVQAVMSQTWRGYGDAYVRRLAVETAKMAKLLGEVQAR
jgi:hypothetical protein